MGCVNVGCLRRRSDGPDVLVVRVEDDEIVAKAEVVRVVAHPVRKMHVEVDVQCSRLFWKAYLSIKQPLTAHDPIHPQVSSRHDP